VARWGAADAARSGYGEEQLAWRGAAMAKSGRRDVPILVSDPASLAALVLSCAGPFRLHGHGVAVACAVAGADCLAISGESTSTGGAGSPGKRGMPAASGRSGAAGPQLPKLDRAWSSPDRPGPGEELDRAARRAPGRRCDLLFVSALLEREVFGSVTLSMWMTQTGECVSGLGSHGWRQS
jgi:hypothetical protein